jgi:hypothetical protein
VLFYIIIVVVVVVVVAAAAAEEPFWAITCLRIFYQICLFPVMCRESDRPVLMSLDFATIYFLQSWVVSLASSPQPGGPGPCIYAHQ